MSETLKQMRSPEFTELENYIAIIAKVKVDKNELKIYAGFVDEALAQSDTSYSDMFAFCLQNKDKVGWLAFRLLKKFKADTFVSGSIILFSIYLFYLEQKSDKQLLVFLKKRSIPRVEIFLKTLKDIYQKLNS